MVVLKNEPNLSKSMECFDIVQTLVSPDSFSMRSCGMHLHLRTACSSASCYNFGRVFPTLKPLASDSPPDQLLSVFTTNSPGGENPPLPKLHEKVPVTILVLFNTCGVVSPMRH